ncbi:MAG TPA: thioredoxin domain-containing protein [Pyrinomonadaceae bacterium]|nr:thioredoxin domain-containing protein [Pyrinomonadaceae bacterium]
MENNNKSSLPIAIIGVVLLAAIGIGGWFLLKGKSDPITTNTPANKTPTPLPANLPPGGNPTWALGPSTALVTVEEFADFQCPTCASMHPKVKELRNALGDRVRIVFRQFPLTQVHPYGYDAACAAEAAGNQGKFWEMQNMLFTNQQSWSNSPDARKLFAEYAKTLGLDVTKFSDDMIGLQVKNKVDADMQRGRAIGVASTPSFYINNKPLGNNLDGLRSAVEAELKKLEDAKQTQSAPANSNTGNANTANANTNK